MSASEPIVSRPVLKYFGSKWRMASRIIELLGTDHTSYVEPYGGSAAVMLQKPKVEIEVINDLNLDVATFFRVLRDRPLELLQQIELTPFSRVEYLDSTLVPDDASDIERARLFFVRSWQGFSGSATQQRNGWRYQSRVYGTRLSKVDLDWHALERLEVAAVRLRQVQVEMDDALSVIKRFDGPETAFYVDPPYPASTRSRQWNKSAYRHELLTQDHLHLLDLLKKVKGRVVLSCYESGLYSNSLDDQGWAKIELPTRNNRHEVRMEILWGEAMSNNFGPQRYYLSTARRTAERIVEELRPMCQRIEIAGSIRRQCPQVGDIDLVLQVDPATQLTPLLDRVARNAKPVKRGEQYVVFELKNGLQLDLWFAHGGRPEVKDMFGAVEQKAQPSNFGMLLLSRTGSKIHNISMCQRAKWEGLHFDPHTGITRSGVVIASATEEEIFDALKMKFVPPEERGR